MNFDGSDASLVWMEMGALTIDLKRMLRVQLKELVHMVEDVEFEKARSLCPHIKHSIVERGNISTQVA